MTQHDFLTVVIQVSGEHGTTDEIYFENLTGFTLILLIYHKNTAI